jgi:mannose-6-phosphate isomerase-like protein (cupin superfamily)
MVNIKVHVKTCTPRAKADHACIRMTINPLSKQVPFTTKDGSRIRSLLDLTNAPVQNQSLAEATVPIGHPTERHYHKLSEEFYFILEGTGNMEIDGVNQLVSPGDAILIPPGAWHQITATQTLRFLCCCAPPYSHADTYFSVPLGEDV